MKTSKSIVAKYGCLSYFRIPLTYDKTIIELAQEQQQQQQQQQQQPIHKKFDNINFNHLKGAGVLHNNLQPIPDCLNASQENFQYPQSKL